MPSSSGYGGRDQSSSEVVRASPAMDSGSGGGDGSSGSGDSGVDKGQPLEGSVEAKDEEHQGDNQHPQEKKKVSVPSLT